MSKYDIIPFVTGLAVGVVAGWYANSVYSSRKEESDEMAETEETPVKGPDKVVITKVQEKPTLEEIKARMKESQKEADYISDEKGYSPEHAKIEVITEEEFLEDDDGFTKDSAEWLEDDCIMLDGVEEPFDEWEHYLGADCIDRFGEGTDDSNCVYIRNNEIGIKYEVVRRKVKK